MKKIMLLIAFLITTNQIFSGAAPLELKTNQELLNKKVEELKTLSQKIETNPEYLKKVKDINTQYAKLVAELIANQAAFAVNPNNRAPAELKNYQASIKPITDRMRELNKQREEIKKGFPEYRNLKQEIDKTNSTISQSIISSLKK